MHGSARSCSANCSPDQCSGAGPVCGGFHAKLQRWVWRDGSKLMASHRTQRLIADMGELVTKLRNLCVEQPQLILVTAREVSVSALQIFHHKAVIQIAGVRLPEPAAFLFCQAPEIDLKLLGGIFGKSVQVFSNVPLEHCRAPPYRCVPLTSDTFELIRGIIEFLSNRQSLRLGFGGACTTAAICLRTSFTASFTG